MTTNNITSVLTEQGLVKVNTTVVTLSATTTTGEIDLGGQTLVGIWLPTIASTSFKIAAAQNTTANGGTYQNLIDMLGTYAAPGADISFTPTSSKWGWFPLSLTAGLRFIKFVFGSSESITFYYATRNIE